MAGLQKKARESWIKTGQLLEACSNKIVNSTAQLGSAITNTAKDVGDVISSTNDLALGIPVGAIGSYSYGKACTCGGRDEVVHQVRRRACRVLHGSYSWLATGVANTLSFGQSTPIQHEWIEISVNTHYYIVQLWCDGSIIMEPKPSQYEVDQEGLSCAAKENDSDVWTIDTHSLSIQLGNIIDWINSEQFTPSYHWSKHNCQHFCKAFMDRF